VAIINHVRVVEMLNPEGMSQCLTDILLRKGPKRFHYLFGLIGALKPHNKRREIVYVLKMLPDIFWDP
jgi:hypothetical protein